MKYLQETARWLKGRGSVSTTFAASTWTLAWCYALGTGKTSTALVACSWLVVGIAVLGRSADES
jgi:hypothetical protein